MSNEQFCISEKFDKFRDFSPGQTPSMNRENFIAAVTEILRTQREISAKTYQKIHEPDFRVFTFNGILNNTIDTKFGGKEL